MLTNSLSGPCNGLGVMSEEYALLPSANDSKLELVLVNNMGRADSATPKLVAGETCATDIPHD